MKVKFLKSHPEQAYFVGDEVEMNEEAAAELLKGKFVQEVKAEKEEKGEVHGIIGKIADALHGKKEVAEDQAAPEDEKQEKKQQPKK